MKICLILVDGMTPDSFADIPEAQNILSNAQYTLTAQTVYPSVTLPCHVSLFHSVTPDRHGTVTNTYTTQVRPINGLCEVLSREGVSCGMFYDWEQLRDVSRPASLAVSVFLSGSRYGYHNTNNILTDKCINTPLDFSFLYMGYTDEAGHAHGWGSDKYHEAMVQCWQNIQKVKNSIPDCVFIVTADHGGHGRTHGTTMQEDMQIPIIIFGNTDKSFDLREANIIDIAPTVTSLFGISSDKDWEGKSFVKEV